MLSDKSPSQRATFTDLVQRVVATSMREFDAARRDFDAGDLIACAGKIHGLRGAIGSLGAERFAESALSLEHAIARQEHVAVDQFSGVATQLGRTLAAAQRWLDQLADRSPVPTSTGAADRG